MKNNIIICLSFLCLVLGGLLVFNCYDSEPKTVKVEIKGMVENPGVYELETGSVVKDLIDEAGGALEGVDLNTINLSKRLDDEMVVILLSEEEIKESFIYVDYECTCPGVINDGTLDEYIDNNIAESEKINLNEATIEDLTTLPGIGESKAEKIIEYRNSNGPFKSTEDIMNVSGIGNAMYEKIKNYIRV